MRSGKILVLLSASRVVPVLVIHSLLILVLAVGVSPAASAAEEARARAAAIIDVRRMVASMVGSFGRLIADHTTCRHDEVRFSE